MHCSSPHVCVCASTSHGVHAEVRWNLFSSKREYMGLVSCHQFCLLVPYSCWVISMCPTPIFGNEMFTSLKGKNRETKQRRIVSQYNWNNFFLFLIFPCHVQFLVYLLSLCWILLSTYWYICLINIISFKCYNVCMKLLV